MPREMNVVFKPRARLLLQLGDQLIRNEQIALFELVKNAYDADSKSVTVTMRRTNNVERGSITIKDFGAGMDIDTIADAWMEPGTDFREKQFKRRERTPKYDRLPIGEKGIGRFAAQKLGNVLELITRKKGHLETVLKINWEDFENVKYLSRIKVNIFERTPQVYKKRTGTRLKITKLRTPWTDGMIRNAYRSSVSIVDPFFSGKGTFNVKFKCPNRPDVLKGIIKPKEIKDLSLWHATCDLENDQFDMRFNFTPWSLMEEKISPRKRCFKGDILDPEERKPKKLNLSDFKIGKVRLELYAYDRDTAIMNLLLIGKKQLTGYLDRNGGIKVYRDEIRVYDYGEKGNDWLNLDIRRVNIPTRRISNNIVIGAVFIDRDVSESLVEKTNREGFIENDSYHLFNKAILYAITEFESERYIDKTNLRAIYGPKKHTEPITATFDDLRNKLIENINNKDLKKELINYVDRAESDYNELKDNLLRSSGSGLSFGIVIHEIEKILKELVNVVEIEKSSKRIRLLVHRLSRLTEGFASLVRSGRKRKNDLKSLIKQALFNVEYRLEMHNISVIDGYSDIIWDTKVSCTRNYMLMVLMNILDNSIWWLSKKYGKKKRLKKIYITISREINDDLTIVIGDNGPGFDIPFDYAIKPFVTKKPGGMGLGLYIADEIMKAQRGKLVFIDTEDIPLPNNITGAVVGLSFRRDEIE